jgi:hypothetical protein
MQWQDGSRHQKNASHDWREDMIEGTPPLLADWIPAIKGWLFAVAILTVLNWGAAVTRLLRSINTQLWELANNRRYEGPS